MVHAFMLRGLAGQEGPSPGDASAPVHASSRAGQQGGCGQPCRALASHARASTTTWFGLGPHSPRGPFRQRFPPRLPHAGLGELRLTHGPWVALSRDPLRDGGRSRESGPKHPDGFSFSAGEGPGDPVRDQSTGYFYRPGTL